MLYKSEFRRTCTKYYQYWWRLSLGSKIIDDYFVFYFSVISVFSVKMCIELQPGDTIPEFSAFYFLIFFLFSNFLIIIVDL